MNRTELITAIAEKTEFSKKDVETIVKTFEEVIKEELVNKNEVKLTGFGTFSVTERAERNGVNPQTQESIVIPASTVPKFKASKSLKEAVNVE